MIFTKKACAEFYHYLYYVRLSHLYRFAELSFAVPCVWVIFIMLRATTTHLMPARPCSSRYVATRTIAAPQIPVPKRLDHLSDEFFFKFLVNFRTRVFVFARQLVVKFRHIAAAFAVKLDRVSPYGAVF